jgi:hypothetical protein
VRVVVRHTPFMVCERPILACDAARGVACAPGPELSRPRQQHGAARNEFTVLSSVLRP